MTSAADASASCAACHDIGEKMAGGDAHRAVACSACHGKHDEYPHPANLPKPACGSCHAGQQLGFSSSVHADAARKGNAGAPDCAVCHASARQAKKTGTVEFRKATLETCGMCHDAVLTALQSSVHGKAVQAGSTRPVIRGSLHGEYHARRNSRNRPEPWPRAISRQRADPVMPESLFGPDSRLRSIASPASSILPRACTSGRVENRRGVREV